MDGPGEYLPDVTEGIRRLEDLPPARILERSRNYPRRPCLACGKSAYRDRVVTRILHDLGDLKANRPIDRKVTYSQHYCLHCDIYFNADRSTDSTKHSYRISSCCYSITCVCCR